jgi:hypothetical protein
MIKYPMGDLETEIYSTEATLELLGNKLTQQLSDTSESCDRIAAGLQNIIHERRTALHDAFNAVFEEWRELRGHK